jgi:hypothetical protein
MRHMDLRTLVDRGRKAGLNTAELYQAISAARPDNDPRGVGLTDGNGFVARVGVTGQHVYVPGAQQRRDLPLAS